MKVIFQILIEKFDYCKRWRKEDKTGSTTQTIFFKNGTIIETYILFCNSGTNFFKIIVMEVDV